MGSMLFTCRKAPYGDSLAREVLDMALAAAAFDQRVALFFTGDGVWQLVKDQDSAAIGQKNHGAILSALPIYDITAIYVDAGSLRERGLKAADLLLPVEAVEASQYADLLRTSDTVMTF